MVIHLQTSVALLCQRFSTWTASMDHGRMDSHTNADLCSSKPFTISLKGQLFIFVCVYSTVLTNNYLMSVQVFAVKRFYPVEQVVCAAAGRTGFCLYTTTTTAAATTKPGTGFFQLYNHHSSQERSFVVFIFVFRPRRVDCLRQHRRPSTSSRT